MYIYVQARVYHSLRPSLQPKSLSGISVVIATPWSDVLSLSTLSPSDPLPHCHLSGKPLRYPAFIFHPPTSPLCSMAHLAVISQHLKAIIPKYECSLTDVSRHSKAIFLHSSSSLPHGEKTKGGEIKVLDVCRPVRAHTFGCIHVCKLTHTSTLIPDDKPLSVQVHAQTARKNTHRQTVYFRRTHRK